MKHTNPKDKNKGINKKILFGYVVTLILIQAAGLVYLFHNLKVTTAVVAAITLGFLAPILLSLIFVMFIKLMAGNQ